MKKSKQGFFSAFILGFFIIFPLLAGAAPKRPSSMAELALYKGADRQQILEEGAKKEGKVTLYTTETNLLVPMVDAFQKKYPFIKIDKWRASSEQISSRAVEEFKSGNDLLDVMGGTQNDMLVMRETGIAMPYYSPNFLQIEDEALTKAPGGGVYAAAYRLSGLGFGYNTKMVERDQLPKTYRDLLDPKWKGKLAIGGSMGIKWAGCIYRNFGEDLLKKIAGQDIVVHMTTTNIILNMIINGEYPASPTVFDSHIYVLKKKRAPVAWVPLEPVIVNLGQVALAKNAPHPHAALLFADFLSSKELVEIARSLGYDNFRKDVPALERRYKKDFGAKTKEEIKTDEEMFNKLFLKR